MACGALPENATRRLLSAGLAALLPEKTAAGRLRRLAKQAAGARRLGLVAKDPATARLPRRLA